LTRNSRIPCVYVVDREIATTAALEATGDLSALRLRHARKSDVVIRWPPLFVGTYVSV
jgi:hypothetical protein